MNTDNDRRNNQNLTIDKISGYQKKSLFVRNFTLQSGLKNRDYY